ncbi:hypothetical protein SEPCBS119000_001538 [Sporothrix epigloea]|uniref:Pali-domain-containing protein n=1 Tax=Sporothrix epigloea TaxID=1892477 RepID=A0ABP0DB94_9PEZI
MARTGFCHHIGSFLLFAATILLIVVSISAPVINHISLLKVQMNDISRGSTPAIEFGSFGYCQVDNGNGHDQCSPRKIGYNPAAVVTAANIATSFSDAAEDSTKILTKIMILHPVAAGVTFIAFLLALGAGFIGSFTASLVSLIAFIITAVVVITDFILFHIIKDHVNDSKKDASAKYGIAIWLLLAAGACQLIGTLVVFFSCCSARSNRQRGVSSGKVDTAAYGHSNRHRF